MSQVRQTTLTLPPRTVRNPAQRANTLHRIDAEADEVQPACQESHIRDRDWNDVPTRVYYPHYDLCSNPECFPEGWR